MKEYNLYKRKHPTTKWTYADYVRKVIDNHNPTNEHKQSCHVYKRGTCYCKSMEKEADFMINPEVDVRLYYPILSDKVFKTKMAIYNEYDLICKTKGKYYAYDYLIKLLYDVDDITKTPVTALQFMKYVQNRREKRTQDGFPVSRKQSNLKYIIGVISNIVVLRQTKIIDIPCTCAKKFMFKQVLPVGQNTGNVMCYTSCLRTLFAAFKRQLKAVPRPDPQVTDDFIQFSKKFIDKYIRPHIHEFDYSFSDWMNHLKANKQKSINSVLDDIKKNGLNIKNVIFGLFCKIEEQQEGGKNRAIANVDAKIKYVMGPICWSLEAFFTKYFPGYCGNKSATDLENYLNQQYAAGYTTSAQGDGSGFDLSQHPEMKQIDKYIYQMLIDNRKIWHVPEDIFEKVVMADYRAIQAKYISKNGILFPFSSIIPGTVFSGSSDTTLMNTVRMALYNHYTLYKAGLFFEKDNTASQYSLLAKGDDFMILTYSHLIPAVERSYLKLWSSKPKDKSFEANYQNKGIGQILKFLKVGDYGSLDFCSNSVIQYYYKGKIKFKIMRRPERMIELSHYNRKAATYNAINLKQYYLDMAEIIEITCGYKPFYRNYIDAYRYYASKLKVPSRAPKVGDKRVNYPSDGHTSFHDSKLAKIVKKYSYLEKDIAIACRLSDHVNEIEDRYVYQYLMEYYHLTPTMIEAHRIALQNPNMLYDPLSDFILKD